jgi:hypothetical protein
LDAPVAQRRLRSSLKLVAWPAKGDIDRDDGRRRARRLGSIGRAGRRLKWVYGPVMSPMLI